MAGGADSRRIAVALAALSQATNVAERRNCDDPPWLMAYRGEMLALVDHAGTFFLADWIEDLAQLSGKLERLFGPER